MTKNKERGLLSSLYGRKEFSDSYIDFQVALMEIREKYGKIYGQEDIIFPKENWINSRFVEGAPLITFLTVSLSMSRINDIFQEIITVFNTFKVCSDEVSQWVKKQADERFLKGIAESVITFDLDALRDISESTPFPVPVLMLASREMVKPFFHFLADLATTDISFAQWSEGYCPICGDAPVFARFSKEEEGKRYLWCERCDFEWPFLRLCCPFCKNSDHKKLKFLTTDFREELRIDVCDRCKGYIKTIDQRKTGNEGETIFLKENAASAYLDIAVEEKGYAKLFPTFQEVKMVFTDRQDEKK